MALLITKDISNIPGIVLSQVYIRIQYTSEYSGKRISVNLSTYTSKESYSLEQDNVFNIPGIPSFVSLDYDRLSGGTDELLFVHESLKTLLSTDPTSTQETINDDGESIIEEVIVGTKFAEPDQISIVDLDPLVV